MRLLMVEDDQDLCESVIYHLNKAGYEVDYCLNGEDGLEYAKLGGYDCILLDRMLPKLDGLALLHTLRTINIEIPVILVTALDGIGDRVKGLDMGADDYLVKPFAIEELLARIRALTRRPAQLISQRQICYIDVSLDLLGLSLAGPNNSCSLSKREAELAEVFLKNPKEPLTRNLIITKVWGPLAEIEEGNLDNYIYFLRRRLNAVGSCLQIKTLRSVGYILEEYHA